MSKVCEDWELDHIMQSEGYEGPLHKMAVCSAVSARYKLNDASALINRRLEELSKEESTCKEKKILETLLERLEVMK